MGNLRTFFYSKNCLIKALLFKKFYIQFHLDQLLMFIKFVINELINIMSLRYLILIETMTKPYKIFKDLRLFMREMELLSHINSPYLIQTIGICLNYEFS